MKNLIPTILISIILSTLFLQSTARAASELTFAEVAGRYKISNPETPVVDLVDLTAEGEISLQEHSPIGLLTCQGQAVISSAVISSTMICDNGTTYQQRITLTDVDIRPRIFVAKVYSSLFDAEFPMTFERDPK